MEERITTAEHGNIVNTYGADGLRASTGIAGQVPTDFIYDYDGSILAHQIWGAYGPQEVWVNGRHFGFINLVNITNPNSVTAVLTQSIPDWLGTERARTDAAGNLEATFCNLPFGDQLTTCFGADPNPADVTHFTGKERDAAADDVNGVNGLDYFGARHYSSSMGRFMSPDPSSLEFADPSNPQSLNLYSYAQNNPLTNTDPTGLDCVYYNDAGSGVESIDRNSSSGECGSTGGDYVNGRIQSIQAFGSGGDTTFGFRSSDSSNNYLTYATAPGSQSDGTSCSGNCDTANGFLQSSNSEPGLFDLSPDQRLQQIAQGVTADSQHSFGCIAQAYGFGGPGTAAYQLGQPVAGTKRFVSPGSSLGTSPLSDALSKAIPIKGRFSAPVGGPGTGVPFRMTKTGNLGRALGRYAPFVGLAADAYATAQLGRCL